MIATGTERIPGLIPASVEPRRGRTADGGLGPANRGVLRAFLQVPLFYKILLANAITLTVVIVAATVFAQAAGGHGTLLFAALLAGGLLISVITNAVVLRLALLPLRRLQETAEQVQAGDLMPGSRRRNWRTRILRV
jgi:hypothetical protein